MKVLHVGVFRDHALGLDHVCRSGFLKNGIDPICFDFRSSAEEMGLERMNQSLLEQGADSDLIFITKGELIQPLTLKRLREKGAQVSIFYGDIRQEPENWLVDNCPHCDVFFMTSAGDVLKHYYEVCKPSRAAFVWNPSNPELPDEFRDVPRSVDPPLFTATVHPHMGSERRAVYEYLCRRRDVSMVGCSDRVFRWDILNRLYYKIHPPHYLRGRDYIERIIRSRFGIGVSAMQNVKYYTSDRLVHYLTFGKCFLAYRFPGCEDVLQNGVHVVYYDGIDDLARKIDYYLEHPDQAEKIGVSGQRKVLEEYNAERIVHLMLDILRSGGSNLFPWVEVYG
ncbi:MAG TPA: glycosyltransferase [bacterium]|nr:glycosyltransferase [bacterium]